MTNRNLKKMIVWIMLILVITACGAGKGSLHVMTFNIRYDNPEDGINAWPNRIGLVSETLNAQRPDLIGFQEVLHHQLDVLIRELPDYGWYGAGRDDGKQGGEYCPVFYRADRFDQLDSGTLWLSETPDSVGSIGWSADLPRILTWIKLFDRSEKDTLLFCNTHFSHVSDEAREYSAKLVLSMMHDLAGSSAAVLAGDFNFTSTKQAYQTLSKGYEELPGLIDTGAFLDAYNGNTTTVNGFGRSRRNRVIDFIWTNTLLKSVEYKVLEIRNGDMYISDHYPVMAGLDW